VRGQYAIPTASDIETEFRAAMAGAGVATDDPIIADGRLHRVHVDGHKRGTRNGAYTLHADCHPAGWYMDYTSGARGTWRAAGSPQADPHARERIAAARAQREAEEQLRYLEAARRAARIWEQATECEGHLYLAHKRVKPWGVRVRGDSLLIPLRDSWGRLWSIQSITPDSTGFAKRFMTGGRTKGCMHWVGSGTQTFFVAEGYATAATLAERTGFGAYVAFSAGNLLAVATELRDIFPGRRIIIAGDADPAGREKAEAAARAARAELSIPEFPQGVSGSDWNDLAVLGEAHHG